MTLIRFENINFLYALLGLIPLAIIFFLFMRSRKKKMQLIGNTDLVKKLSINRSGARHSVKFLLIFLALTSLIIAWANPQIGTKYETVKREGVDVMIALDVSKSMKAQDIVPDRMLKAKQLVSNLIDQMANDRIGLIVFAGNAYLQMPLTVDYYAGKMYLKTIDADMMPTQGTAIADAVDLAKRSFNQDESQHKILIIISDGENHEADADASVISAVEQGVKVYTVGVGSTKGAPIPENNSGALKKDADGNLVLTKLNEDMLASLAKSGNGKYFNIEEGNVASKLISEISLMEGKELEEKVIADYKNQFPIFLSITLILLFLEFLISERKRTYFGKWFN